MNSQSRNESTTSATNHPPLDLVAHLTLSLSETFNAFADALDVSSDQGAAPSAGESGESSANERADIATLPNYYPDAHPTLAKQITRFQEVVTEARDGEVQPNQYDRLHTHTDILAKQAHRLHLETIGIDPEITPSDLELSTARHHAAAVVGIANTLRRILAQSRLQSPPQPRPLPSQRDGYAFTRINKADQRDYIRVTDPNGDSAVITPSAIGAIRDELYSIELAI